MTVRRKLMLRGDRAHVLDVGHEGLGVPRADLDRLDVQMNGARIVRVEVAHSGLRRRAKGDQRGDPLSVGRDLVQVRAIEFLRDGLYPVRRMGRKNGLGRCVPWRMARPLTGAACRSARRTAPAL